MKITSNIDYAPQLKQDYFGQGSPSKMFLDDQESAWLICGAYSALNSTGPIWFDMPESIVSAAKKLDLNDRFGEIIIYKRAVFIQTNKSIFYRNNYSVKKPGTLEKVWRDYYYTAFYCAARHIIAHGGTDICIDCPVVGNGWPQWLWGLFIEAHQSCCVANNAFIKVSDLGDLPSMELILSQETDCHLGKHIEFPSASHERGMMTSITFTPMVKQSRS